MNGRADPLLPPRRAARSMRCTFTSVSFGMTRPLALRAVHVLPSAYTAPVGTVLSMVSVTRAVWPSTRSALVGVSSLWSIFCTSGRVAASAAMLTTKNRTICTHRAAPSTAASRPATAPSTNQMETSPTVTASTMPKTTMAAIQMTIIAPPFGFPLGFWLDYIISGCGMPLLFPSC